MGCQADFLLSNYLLGAGELTGEAAGTVAGVAGAAAGG
jgi:hypothetical protein